MHYLLCTHRVADFERFTQTLREHASAHAAAGLRARHVWRGVDDPRQVFFLFEVADLEKARAFLASLDAERAKPGAAASDFPDMYLVAESPL
jgi:hypothetical protein